MLINDPRDTRLMGQEKCAGKRLPGAFETDRAGIRPDLRQLINVSGTRYYRVRPAA